jgi:NADPH2:quinone reductase
MRAVVLSEPGGPERLEVQDVPEPQAQQGQVLIDVRAAGINFADVLVRQGRYPQPPPLPTILGSEVAGEADGLRLMAFTRQTGGGYAQRVAVDEEWVVPLPEAATFEEGASFLLTFLTAWIPLTRQARVQDGTTVLVHAAAGGVGSAAVQVARHLGARVVATAGSDEKRRIALDLGAEEVYAYDTFAEQVRANVVFDPVGGDVFSASLRTLEPLGVLIGIGFAGGQWQPVDPALLVGRNVGVQGFYLGRLMAREPHLVRPAIEEILELWRGGAVKPLVGAAFPLERAPDAHRLLEERRSYGKVVLVP